MAVEAWGVALCNEGTVIGRQLLRIPESAPRVGDSLARGRAFGQQLLRIPNSLPRVGDRLLMERSLVETQPLSTPSAPHRQIAKAPLHQARSPDRVKANTLARSRFYRRCGQFSREKRSGQRGRAAGEERKETDEVTAGTPRRLQAKSFRGSLLRRRLVTV